MLIDIQQKLQAGKGAGYENWVKSFNLKQMSQTLAFLQENGLVDYEVLAERAADCSAAFNTLAAKQKQLEAAMRKNAALQKHIVSTPTTTGVSPQTGDNSNMGMWLLLLIASMAILATGVIYMIKTRTNRNKQDN